MASTTARLAALATLVALVAGGTLHEQLLKRKASDLAKRRSLQSLFGGASAVGSEASACPLAAYQLRSTEVDDVCCADPDACSTGLPDTCNLDCAVVFMNYFSDCSELMTTLQGAAVVDQLEQFNQRW